MLGSEVEMPVCTRCKKDWPEQYWVCPEDGTVLTAARAVGEGLLAGQVGIPREEDLAPGTMIGEYCVEGKLGEGGMATVFAATQPLIGKKVAIKVISRRLCADLHAVERFIGEARTVNQIQHPNLVDIFAFGVLPDGRAYLVMEWLQGDTLQSHLARQRLPAAQGIEILLQIVDALEAAHEKGVVHRDLKPANVFLVERRGNTEQSVKLLDFGIAKLADSDASVPKTRSGVAMGTAGYMSPEQARGKNVDHRTDIYALGCVAYEVMLGQVPFLADTAIDILAMHLASAPPPPRSLWPDIPATLANVLVEMLAKEPDKRPSLAMVKSTLLASQRSITPTMGISVAGVILSRRAQRLRRRALWVGLVATLLAASIVSWRVAWREPEPIPPPPPVRTNPPSRAAAPLPSAPRMGTLLVRAPAGAMVNIDEQEFLVGPAGVVRAIVASDVEHAIVVLQPHKGPIKDRVRVAPGATAEYRALGRSHRDKFSDKGAIQLSPIEAPALDKSGDTPPQKSNSGDYTLDPF
jgi:serine/threonine protein kinase